MDKPALVSAIEKSGGGPFALEEVDDLLARAQFLHSRGRYGALLSQLSRTNDPGNFQSLALEINFAYHFESIGKSLIYEVKQDEYHSGSIDFLRRMQDGQNV